MDPLGSLFDIVLRELGKKQSTSPLARELRVALIGYYGGFVGALIGGFASWRVRLALGMGPNTDALALFVGALAGSTLGFLGGSPLGSIIANAVRKKKVSDPEDGWLITGGFAGSLVGSVALSLAFILS
jgi:hypothetical protein